MKFLRGEVEELEREGVRITTRVMDTVMQSNVSSLSQDTSLVGQVKLASYVLHNCVDSVWIDGQKFDPVMLATKADISDIPTLKSMLRIGALVTTVAFPDAGEEKKSEPQPQLGTPENTAESARSLLHVTQ